MDLDKTSGLYSRQYTLDAAIFVLCKAAFMVVPNADGGEDDDDDNLLGKLVFTILFIEILMREPFTDY